MCISSDCRRRSLIIAGQWAVISDQLVEEYVIVTLHSFEVDVATQDSGTIVL